MIIIPIIVLTLYIFFEIANFSVYGWFVSKEVTKVYMNLDENKLKLNPYDPSILMTKYYITNVTFSFLCKYHINGLGTVPRWSKLHKRINEYFAIACMNSEQLK